MSFREHQVEAAGSKIPALLVSSASERHADAFLQAPAKCVIHARGSQMSQGTRTRHYLCKFCFCAGKKKQTNPEAPGCVLTNTQRIQKRVFSPFKASCRDASANSSGSSRSSISLVMQTRFFTPDLGMGQPACPETTHYPPPPPFPPSKTRSTSSAVM